MVADFSRSEEQNVVKIIIVLYPFEKAWFKLHSWFEIITFEAIFTS